jgi:hypothetical protein
LPRSYFYRCESSRIELYFSGRILHSRKSPVISAFPPLEHMSYETEQGHDKTGKSSKDQDVLRLALEDPAAAKRRLAKEDDWLLWETALRH